MAMHSICPDITLEDPKTDYSSSLRIEQYRFSSHAAYFAAWPSAKYLPFLAVRQAWIQDSLLPLTGTCGKAIPVTVMRIRYKGNYYQTLTFEKRVNAQKAMDILQEHCPSAVFGPEPVGEERAAFLAALSPN
ncbi:MAG: hypothetical protein E7445_01595 [Ruminococcaceae bacterium]|nr:hypothetical protein [Oscillospiraceae bacterium]